VLVGRAGRDAGRSEIHHVSADVIPIGEATDDWRDDIVVKVAAPRPRLTPGSYEARSVSLTKFNAFNRLNIELGFDVYEGRAERGVVLARIPLYARLPGARGLSANSKLARLFHLLHHGAATPPRWGRLPLSQLRHKLWRVIVADAMKDTNDEELPERLRYSVIQQVVERLA
jgi:hypothetical protein